MVLVFSCYCGILYQKHRYQGQSGFGEAEYDNKRRRFIKHIGRLLVYLGLLTLFAGLGWATTLAIDKLTTLNTFYVYVFKVFLPNFFGGFIMFAYGDAICLALGLYVKGEALAKSQDLKLSGKLYQRSESDEDLDPNKSACDVPSQLRYGGSFASD